MRFEKYPATVTNNQDPLKRGRIKVSCTGLLGDRDSAYPDWISPTFDWGWFYVPDVDEEVEIEAVVEDAQAEETFGQAFLEAPTVRWRGKRFQSDGGDAPRPPNEQLTANYGKRRGFATPSGHVLLFDDTEGEETVTLSWKKTGAEEYSFLSMLDDGSVVLDNSKGSLLYLDATNGSASLVDEHGNSYSSDATAIRIIDTHNNSIEMKDSVITVLGNKDTLVTAGSNVMVVGGSDISLTAAQKAEILATTGFVELGGGAEFVMLSAQLLAWIGQANTLFAALFAAIGSPIPTIVVPTAVPAAATKVKAT